MKQNEKLMNLYDCMVKVSNQQEAADFLDDLCTTNEIEMMADRLWAAKLFMEDHTYQEVIGELKLSSATLSRVSKCVKNGKGYRNILNK